MNYKIIVTPTFEKDIENIISFYSDKNPNYSKRLFTEIEKTIISLNDFPERFAKIYDSNIPNKTLNLRQFICDNYRIIYQIKNGYIYILTILGQNLLNTDKLAIK